MKKLFTLLAIVSVILAFAPEKEVRFEIIFDDKKIGHVEVVESQQGEHVVRDLKTVSDAHVFITIHVETEAKVTRNKAGLIVEGIGYRHANRGSEDVHAHTQIITEDKYKVNRNGKSWVLDDHPIDYCVADMYFKEPVGKSQVYSNMYGANLKIASLGGGKYHVITPDDKDSYYTYQNGLLKQVVVSTPLGKVKTRRI